MKKKFDNDFGKLLNRAMKKLDKYSKLSKEEIIRICVADRLTKAMKKNSESVDLINNMRDIMLIDEFKRILLESNESLDFIKKIERLINNPRKITR